MTKNPIDFVTFLEAQNILFEHDAPKFHIEVAEWFEDNVDVADSLLQIFRGAGKSHLVCLYAVWRLLCDPNLTIIVLSGTSEVAQDNAGFIRRIIEGNPFTKHLRGDGKWTDTKFFVKRNIDTRNASVACTSLQSGNVGKRCDLMIIDDLETPDTVSPAGGPEKIRWMLQECKTIAKRQRIYIGTPWATDSVYTLLEDRGMPTLKYPWVDGIWPNHPDGLFDKKWADELTEQVNKENREWYWNSQFLLIPDQPDIQGGLDADMLQKYSEELVARTVFGLDKDFAEVYIGEERIVDVATYWDYGSSLKGRDKSVFAVIYKSATNKVFVHTCIALPPRHPELGYAPQCDRIVDECIKLKLSSVIVEGNAATPYDTALRDAAKARNVALYVKTQTRHKNSAKHLGLTGHSQVKHKLIYGYLGPLLNTNNLFIKDTIDPQFIAELRQFPYGKHDDFVDAVTGAISNLTGDAFSYGGATSISGGVNNSRSFIANEGNKIGRFGRVA